MSDTEPIVLFGSRRGGAAPRVPYGSAWPRAVPATIAFDRSELRSILDLYGRKVAAGEWRDYAIDHLGEKAVFSVFRRACETPLYRIEKQPRLARRQGAYAVIGRGGQILRRGHELGQVLGAIDRRPPLALA
jgi:hypothetical protein